MVKKKPSKKMVAILKEHEAFLLKMGVKPRGKRIPVVEFVDLREGWTENAKLGNNISGHGPKKAVNEYTGSYIKGIATMHKSNAVPITSKEQAIDSANMRRG